MKTVPIISLPIAATHYAGAVDWICEHALKADRAYAVEAANTHVVALAKVDSAFGKAMEQFDLICPDGMPLVWAINSQLSAPEKLTDRVYGPTLMLKTLQATENLSSFKHFLLGGKPSTLERLVQRFNSQFPKLQIVGSHSPPFGTWPDNEFETIHQKITESGANLIWVGLGCPKQEFWIAHHKAELPPGVYFGIGAAFAFHAGEVRQAPHLIQRFGLEWAYRVAMEPRRLFKRYFTYNSLFVYHLIKSRIRP